MGFGIFKSKTKPYTSPKVSKRQQAAIRAWLNEEIGRTELARELKLDGHKSVEPWALRAVRQWIAEGRLVFVDEVRK